MKNIFYYFTILLGIFTLSSCDPNQDQNGDFLRGMEYDFSNTDTGGSSTTDRLLKKTISHSYDDVLNAWEDNTVTFNYTNKRLTSYSDESSGTININYNSSNKISNMYATGMTSTFEYSGSNVSKITTIFEGVSKSEATYTYNGGKLVKSAITMEMTFMPIPVKTYTEDTYEYQGDNVVKNTTKIGAYDPVTGTLEIEPTPLTTTYQYDTKKSPNALLPKEFWLFFSSVSAQTGSFLSANNVTKMTVVDQTNASTTQDYTNAYDSENYLTKMTAGQEYTIYEYQK